MGAWIPVTGGEITIPTHYSASKVVLSMSFQVDHSVDARADFRIYDVSNGAVLLGGPTLKSMRTIGSGSFQINHEFGSAGFSIIARLEAYIVNAMTLTIRDIFWELRVLQGDNLIGT